MKKQNIKTRYYTKGLVYGYDWYNNKVACHVLRFDAPTYEELITEINKRFKDGSLEQGFGLQSLTGYEMEIYVISTVTVDGLDYERTDLHSIVEHNKEEELVK